MYTSIMHYNHRHNMVWSIRPRALVICRYRLSRLEIVEFSQACSLGYNIELLKKAANSSPESGRTERIGSPTTAERAILHVKVCYLLSMQIFSAYTSYHMFSKIPLGTIEHITCFKNYRPRKHFPTCLKLTELDNRQ